MFLLLSLCFLRPANTARPRGWIQPHDYYDPSADMKALSNAHKKKGGTDSSSYLSKEHLMELRKVQNERVEAGKMKLLGMDIKQNMGVRMDGTVFDD
ncbi:hypothetical protein F5878DRAFT_658507 [Lentinula raphanica]|uniref:Uncharacterized protein n=1 Tax=Lentinula raphanica TaxID=153919 RepID=A0AA38PEZ6_9AGAR|nr:hypothetical protein F5878DRAFT_658507 [Lentinula raphanica]